MHTTARVPGVSDYLVSAGPEPHIGRTKKMLQAHPELRQLFGNQPSTILWTALIVGIQVAFCAWSARFAWDATGLIWLALSVFFVGATCNHALFVIIHEATHNLIFKGSVANRWAGIFAGLPLVVPAAMGFRAFHLLHHRYQGEMDFDADLAGPREAAWVGSSPIRKMIWLLLFAVFEGVVRPARVKKVDLLSRWGLTNLVVEVVFMVAIFWAFGAMAVVYLFLSLLFSIGLHPFGARWIQEHYVFKEGQETYSYYGPLNKLTFNVGFHNEHHDLMMVPWSKLPEVKRIAPEFYDSLMFHRSWTGLLVRFIFDRKVTLYSRVTRPSHKPAAADLVVQTGATAAALGAGVEGAGATV